MEIHTINKNNSFSTALILSDKYYGDYYFLDDIVNAYPNFSKSYTGRKVLKNYEFNEDDYNFIIYSPFNNIKYKFYDESYSKAKLFIKREWVEKNVINIEKDYIQMPPSLKIKNLPDFMKNGENSLKFRGERTRKKLFVSVEGVAKFLEINSYDLKKNVINGEYGLEKNKHFVLCEGKNKNNRFIKIPYFTYKGFLSYVFITKSPLVYKIVKFCETVLFNSMFGTSEEKTEMVLTNIIQTSKEVAVLKKKLGVAISESKNITAIYGIISCLYLLIFEEREGTYVVKFGKSKDLKTRLADHAKTYGNVSIKFCRYIDNSELDNAEKELYVYFNERHTPIKKWPENDNTVRKEVFEIKKGELKNIKKFYDELSVKYGGKVDNINKNMKASEKNKNQEIEKIKHFYELKIKDIENAYKLVDMEKVCEIKTLKKDIENLNLKLEMANLKLSIFSK